MKAVIGLGNVGEKYTGTRHNFGWLAVERVAKAIEAGPFQENRALQAFCARGRSANEAVVLALPTTYMNDSGAAVQALLSFYKIPLENALIVQDELDFPLGTFKFLQGGSAGGHNGIRSIEERLGGQAIARLRLGIGRPTTPQPIEDYVLERFTSDERPVTDVVLADAEKAIQDWISHGLDAAQQAWNGKKR